MFKRKCKITFICHGATVYSEENRICDNEAYPPINEAGEDEIRKICEWLKFRGVKNDAIYVSPAQRTIQSAQMIAKVFKSDIQILDDLKSRRYGLWSGLTYDMIEKKYPQMLEKFHENPCSFCPENGENIVDFNVRVSKIIKKLVSENIGNRIIVVTHSDVIRSSIASAIKLTPENQAKIYIKTGSASQISYFDSWASLMYSGYVPL